MVLTALGTCATEALRTQVSIRDLSDVAFEILSNSLDARATRITVHLRSTGVSVCDDGHGITADQLHDLGVRFTSSKSPSTASLGYRGEALSSIAYAAADLQITSVAAGSAEAHQKRWRHGQVVFWGPCSSSARHSLLLDNASSGTRVEVSGLTGAGTAASLAAHDQERGASCSRSRTSPFDHAG